MLIMKERLLRKGRGLRGGAGLELLSPPDSETLTSRRSRFSGSPSPSPLPSPSQTPSPSPSPSPASVRRKQGTSSRPCHYILGHAPPSLPQAKLPKTGPVLARLISKAAEKKHTKINVRDAAREMVSEVKEVWAKHFPTNMINGIDLGHGGSGDKIIKADYHIAEMLCDLYMEWYRLEFDSRRPAMFPGTSFLKRKEDFVEKLEMPLDIRLQNYKEIIKNSGILDYEEDIKYLEGQMTKEQPGTFASLDTRQKKCEQRRKAEKAWLEGKGEEMTEEREEAANSDPDDLDVDDLDVDDLDVDDLDNNDKDYVYEGTTRKPKKKDVMSHISQAADAQNLSVRKRLKITASTLNAAGVDLASTNVSRSSAWRKGQQQRLKKAKEVRAEFVVPEKVVIHWDGKMLRLRGRVASNRVCVYLSGVDKELRQLLGIPEAEDGTGAAEFRIVREALDKWMVNEEIIGMVFDTTATNTGRERGCCR